MSGEMRVRNGKPIAAYIDKEVAGFAIHLLQK